LEIIEKAKYNTDKEYKMKIHGIIYKAGEFKFPKNLKITKLKEVSQEKVLLKKELKLEKINLLHSFF
jgi:hypothetical protein